jgi:hypothetical protein
LAAGVLQDPEHRLRKPPSLDLLRPVISEVEAPLRLHVGLKNLIHQLLRDSRGDEPCADLI